MVCIRSAKLLLIYTNVLLIFGCVCYVLYRICLDLFVVQFVVYVLLCFFVCLLFVAIVVVVLNAVVVAAR